MTFLYGACNSDEVPQESESNSQGSATDTDSNSNTNTDSNATPATPGSNSESESDSVPTDGGATDSMGDDTSASTPSTPSQASAEDTNSATDTDATASDSTPDTESAGEATVGDTDTDTAGACVEPPASDECETCLYQNCMDEFCACKGDQKCLCVMDCLDGIVGGDENKLDDLLGLDLDGLLGNLLDGVIGDLLDDLTSQDVSDLTEVLECLTSDPCGVPLGIDLEDLLDGSEISPDELLDLDNLLDILNVDDLDAILENILEVAGNSLSPLLTCAELTNPDGACGTICPLEESVLDD